MVEMVVLLFQVCKDPMSEIPRSDIMHIVHKGINHKMRNGGDLLVTLIIESVMWKYEVQ